MVARRPGHAELRLYNFQLRGVVVVVGFPNKEAALADVHLGRSRRQQRGARMRRRRDGGRSSREGLLLLARG